MFLPNLTKGDTLHKMVRSYSKQTKESFENHAMPVDRYIILRYHSFLYFLTSTIDLTVNLNNLLITIVILFIYI